MLSLIGSDLIIITDFKPEVAYDTLMAAGVVAGIVS